MTDPTLPSAHESIRTSIDEAARLAESMKQRTGVLADIAGRLIETLGAGNKIMTCGNGGSAAEALHLAEELVGRFQSSPPRRALPAYCLCADPTALTCIANDFGYEQVFARQVDAHARPGDVLVVLSTSGRSPSILQVLRRARALNVVTVGLLGPVGSPAETLCDYRLTLDGHTPARIQEAHLLAIHVFLEQIDRAFAD